MSGYVPPLCGEISYFKHAKEISKESNYKIKMGAVLVVGKSIIKGKNIIKTHPKYGYSVHAEMNCLIKAKKYDIIGSSIFVYREKQNGKPAIARPCSTCMKELKDAGVRKVYYSCGSFPFWKVEIL